MVGRATAQLAYEVEDRQNAAFELIVETWVFDLPGATTVISQCGGLRIRYYYASETKTVDSQEKCKQ